MPYNKIETIIEELSLPIVREMGFELVDVEYKKERNSWFLRLFIDKPGGITIDDCQNFSEMLSEVLDHEDPIPQSYYLEVSSPGLDRPLKKESDFVRYKGFKVDLKLFKPINGKKSFTGELVGLEDGDIVIKNQDGTMMRFKKNDVAIVRLAVEF